MVDIGVSVNIPSSSHIGAYPIHWACVEGHVSIVDLLLRNGVPMDICDTNGCTPLITACQHGNSHLVCYLLGRGANKAICDRNGDTALHWASYKGNKYTNIKHQKFHTNFVVHYIVSIFYDIPISFPYFQYVRWISTSSEVVL
ncbi:UNVERIFIED_CONTAM: inversin [Trichonephila clavipes]